MEAIVDAAVTKTTEQLDGSNAVKRLINGRPLYIWSDDKGEEFRTLYVRLYR